MFRKTMIVLATTAVLSGGLTANAVALGPKLPCFPVEFVLRVRWTSLSQPTFDGALMPSHWQRSKMTFCQSRKNESSRPGWESWASCNPKCRGSNPAAPAGESGLCASIRPRADGRQEPPAL
jgi:hypothetical protein